MTKKISFHINLLFASGFYTGFTPKAPGTAGSLAALLLWAIIEPSILGQALIIIFAFLIGVFTSNKLETSLGKDAPIIVIDEFVGLFITLFASPFSIPVFACGFIFFRFFDILKPLGINSLQKINGGMGVMLDDVLAGVYSLICLRLAIYFNLF